MGELGGRRGCGQTLAHSGGLNRVQAGGGGRSPGHTLSATHQQVSVACQHQQLGGALAQAGRPGGAQQEPSRSRGLALGSLSASQGKERVGVLAGSCLASPSRTFAGMGRGVCFGPSEPLSGIRYTASTTSLSAAEPRSPCSKLAVRPRSQGCQMSHQREEARDQILIPEPCPCPRSPPHSRAYHTWLLCSVGFSWKWS
jgi:hypothetical protein